MYHGSYSGRQLSVWAHRLAEQAQARLPIYAYFNNDPGAVAVENASTLRSILRKLVRLDMPVLPPAGDGGVPVAKP
jgi:uncharacterized protein YecE (DUF72 family)